MLRQKLLNDIITHLAGFEIEVKAHNSAGRTDINLFAEGVIEPILNEILQCKLINQNAWVKQNYPAIDLADMEKGIAVQVTSSMHAEKIYATLSKFIKHGLHNSFQQLYIFVISSEIAKYKQEKIEIITGQVGMKFSGQTNILTINFIRREIEKLQDDSLQKLYDILEFQMQPDMIKWRQDSYQNEVHQIAALRRNSKRYFDRKIESAELDMQSLSPLILPNARMLDNPAPAHSSDKPFFDIVIEAGKKELPHLFLIGEGGSGKTSSLLWLWKRLLESDEFPVPIFLHLPDMEEKLLSLESQVKDLYYTIDLAAEKFEEVIAKHRNNRGLPKVVFLLDAHNQLSSDDRILADVVRSCDKWPGAQFIIASRHYSSFNLLQNFTTIELLPLRQEQIFEYKTAKLGTAMKEGETISLLSNPLRLTMYCKHSVRRKFIEHHKDTSSILHRNKIRGLFRPMDSSYNKGDLCHDYFESLATFELIKRKELSPKYVYGIFDWLFPAIGYLLESTGRFSLSREELHILINRWSPKFMHDLPYSLPSIETFIVETVNVLSSLTNKLDYTFTHHEFRDYFSALFLQNQLIEWVDRIKTEGFSYKQCPACLKDALIDPGISYYLGCINQEHRNIPLCNAEGYWDNSHYLIDTPVRHALIALKKKFQSRKLKFIVRNLVNIYFSVKGDLSGDDFSYLFLKGVIFSDKILSRINGIITKPESAQFFACSFEGSAVDLQDFVPRTHIPSKKHALYHADFYDNIILKLRIETVLNKTYLYSCTKSEIIKWDMSEARAVEKMSIPYIYDFGLKKVFGHSTMLNPYIPFCPIDYFLKSGDEAVTVTKDNSNSFYVSGNENFFYRGYYNQIANEIGWLGIWNIKRSRVARAYDIYKAAWYCFGKDDQLLAVTSPDGSSVQIWDDNARKKGWKELGEKFRVFHEAVRLLGDIGLVTTFESQHLTKPIAFHPDKTVILMTDASGKIFEWDYQNGRIVLELTCSSFHEIILGYDLTGQFVVTSSCRYHFKDDRYQLVSDFFDLVSQKHEEYGRLGFWSTIDGELKKTIDTGLGAEIISRILFHQVENKSILIAASKSGGIKVFDYENLLPIKTISRPVYALYPLINVHLPFSNNFITAYRNGIIKKFESGTHKCVASALGKLIIPERIFFSPKFLKMATLEFLSGRVEIWNLDNLTPEEEITAFKKYIIKKVAFSFDLDKIYAVGEIPVPSPNETLVDDEGNPTPEGIEFMKLSLAMPNVLLVYDRKQKQLTNVHYLPDWIFEWEFRITPSGKTLLYISKNDRKKLMIYDMVSDKFKYSTFEWEVTAVCFDKAAYYGAFDSVKSSFWIIDKQGGLHCCNFDEPNWYVQYSTIEKHEAFQQFNALDLKPAKDEGLIVVLSNDNYAQHPIKHERFEYDINERKLVKIVENEEKIDRDIYIGEPYNTERGYDYNILTGSQLILFQNSLMENYTIEVSQSLKESIFTHHGTTNSINVAGCKFPFVYTKLDKELRYAAILLEQNGAIFPLSYHSMNYPNTYAILNFKNRKEISKQSPFKKVRFHIGISIIAFINFIIWLFRINRDKKHRSQQPGNPYNDIPNGEGSRLGGQYYPSKKYEWI